MIIIATINYPTESVREMAKRFLEAPGLPDYITRKGPYVTAKRECGIQSISLFELENAKLADGMRDIGNYMANFFGIPGFRYDFLPYMDVTEALKTIGM